MIAKISSNISLFATLLYNKNKIDKQEAMLLSSQNVYERADGLFSMRTTIKSFEPYLVANKRTENPVFHVSINPSPKDKLSDDEYREIADRYMQDMGYGNQPYMVFKHTDIDRIHLHVVSVRVDETGKKIDSNYEKMRSMGICRQIEKDYNLHPAEKQEQQQGYTPPTKPLNYKEGDIKRQIGNIAKAIITNYNFQSVGEYRSLLEMFNVTVEEVKVLKNEKVFHGLVYSALQNSSTTNGKENQKQKIGTPFKSSLFGKSINLLALEKHFERSKQQIDNNKTKEYLKPVIRQEMQQNTTTTDFKKALLKYKIGCIFRQNDDGRIYGVSFIDYQNQTILNGSRLGKEFSANVFNELFKDSPERNIEQPEQSISPSVETAGVHRPADESSFMSSLFEQHGTDYEEENFVREKEKEEHVRQKKKRKGLSR